MSTADIVMMGLRMIGEGTAQQVAERVGLSAKVCRDYLVQLVEEGRGYVCRWQVTAGEPARVFAFGAGENAPKPSRTEAYRQWEQENPEAAAKSRARRSTALIRSKRASVVVKHLLWLQTDHRPFLERALCHDLGSMPMVPAATGTTF